MKRNEKLNVAIFSVLLLAFCAFTNNVMAQGNGTSADPWPIKDGGGDGVRAYVSGSTLHIEGSGNMADFWSSTKGEAPWNDQYYSNSSSITTVVIQDGVTNIGDRAFHDLKNLQKITIPSSVTKIGRQAFYMEHVPNNNFQSITIPNSVTEIEGEAFKNCTNLKTVTIENGPVALNFSSFYYNGSEYPRGTKTDWFSGCPLQTLHFGRTLSSSSGNPFSGTSIQTLTIGNTVTLLGSKAFANCTGLINVTLEDGITPLSFNYNSNLFSNCPIKVFHWGRNLIQFSSPIAGNTALTSVTIGNNVTSVGSSAFSGCTALTSVSIPASIKTIESSMFYQCSNITSFTIPSSITSIESDAFRYSGLTSLNIPSNVVSIGSRAFADCTGLTNVTLADGTTSLSFNYNSNLFSNCPIKTFHWGRNLVQFSSPVAGNKVLTSVTIGQYVASVGSSAFSGCTGLTSITIPTSITIIESSMFYQCSDLKNITIPSSITSIESDAFRYSGLTNIDIPNNVISIGGRAFADCTGLTDATLADGITSLSFNYSSNLFSNCPIKTFHWGRNLVNYSSPVAGNKILTSVTIGNNVTSIGSSDFSGCTGLTSVTIPSSITSIGSQAFYGCYGLKEIHSKNPNPPTAGSNCFYDVYNTCKLFVPGGAETKYKAAAEWKKFFSITSAIIPIKADNIAIQSLVNGIAIETKEQMPVSIYNLSGQKIYESIITGNTEIQLDKGIYIVRANNTSAKVVVP